MEDRVSVDPAICGGKPTIRGTRIMLKNILDMIAGGYTIERILEAYPELVPGGRGQRARLCQPGDRRGEGHRA
jgi:hypothetical protein